MVSQSQNDEWENSPSRNGSTLSLECRQHPPAIRTPPSYFDAVRSRHSLSQPDAIKPDKSLNPQQVKYSSLPRPLPQRLQTCPPNLYELQQKPAMPWPDGQQVKPASPEKSFSQPIDSNSGFQVYTRPPGPANHVPLSPRNQLIGMSNNSTLPRCFARNGPKMELSTSNVPRDVHQPLSIIVKQHEFQEQPNYKQNDYQRNGVRPAPDQMPYGSQPMRRAQPHLPPQPIRNHQPQLHPSTNRGDRNNITSRNPERENQTSAGQYKAPPMFSKQQQPSYRYPDAANYPRYTKSGTLPAQHPRRDYIIEPAISIRTGPLGSYPDSPQVRSPKNAHQSKSQNLLECAEVPKNIVPYPQSNTRRCESQNMEASQLHVATSRRCQPSHSSIHSGTLSPSSVSSRDHYSQPPNSILAQRRDENDVFHNSAFSQSSTLPRKKSREKPVADSNVLLPTDFPVEHSTVFQHPSSTNGIRNPNRGSSISPSKLHHHLLTPISDQHFKQKNSDDDSHSSSPSKSLICETPEEAGLVMIVESRDLSSRVNSVAKDLVKPTPRIPMSPTLAVMSNHSMINNNPVTSSNNYHRTQPYSPSSNFNLVNSQFYDYQHPLSPNGYVNQSTQANVSSSDIRTPMSKSFCNGEVYRAVPGNAQSSKSQNGFILRRTPLSSSTASLSSEISSVSSRHRKTQDTSQNRVLSSHRKSLETDSLLSVNSKDKKNEISPSPWVREEKEQLQKQQILGARRARDDKIAYLESLPDRTDKQEEWLRILRLEQEFQRRAEEIGDDDEDEDDETLLDRAEHRERMLLMQDDKQRSESFLSNKVNSTRSDMHSSSDQWLVNSQSKHPKRKDQGGLNGSFEIEQFNDLLETMNMSPVIREKETYEEDTYVREPALHHPMASEVRDATNGSRTDTSISKNRNSYFSNHFQVKPVPAPRISKTTSPVPRKPNSDIKLPVGASLDFCFPVENSGCAESHTMKPSGKLLSEECASVNDEVKPLSRCFPNNVTKSCDNSLSIQYKSSTENLHHFTSKNNTTKVDNKMQSQAEEKHYSKLAVRIPVDVVPKEKSNIKERDSVFNNTRASKVHSKNSYHKDENILQKGITSGKFRSNSTQDSKQSAFTSARYNVKDRPSSDSTLGSLYSLIKTYNGPSKDTNAELDGKSPEYKKIWNSRPEKLTFMDKIRKFSLHAGEEDLPKDKVKNSRAQRELEIKFSGDLNKTVELASS